MGNEQVEQWARDNAATIDAMTFDSHDSSENRKRMASVIALAAHRHYQPIIDRLRKERDEAVEALKNVLEDATEYHENLRGDEPLHEHCPACIAVSNARSFLSRLSHAEGSE